MRIGVNSLGEENFRGSYKEFFQIRPRHETIGCRHIVPCCILFLSDQQKTFTVANDARREQSGRRENVKEYGLLNIIFINSIYYFKVCFLTSKKIKASSNKYKDFKIHW